LYFHVRQWNNTLWHRGTSIFFGTRWIFWVPFS
jgi:hypothetical protein